MPKQSEDWKNILGHLLPKDYVPEPEPEVVEEKPVGPSPSKQTLFVTTDAKQRKGKTVTIVSGYEGSESDLETLGKMLKAKCGVGGTVKDGKVILQGDFKQKLADLLAAEGFKVKMR